MAQGRCGLPCHFKILFTGFDIVYSTMDRRKLDKLQREIERMRRASVRASDVQSIARKLGRQIVNRGKEPMWDNIELPGQPVLAIPSHGGKDLSPGVKNSVLDQLEDDILAWEERLLRNGSSNGCEHEE
jgi:hypothetical protein